MHISPEVWGITEAALRGRSVTRIGSLTKVKSSIVLAQQAKNKQKPDCKVAHSKKRQRSGRSQWNGTKILTHGTTG